MTTIIAKNRELIGDRRKIVNAHKAGIVGIRDEAKIHKTDFCLYGICGFEATDDLDISMPKILMLRRLAVLFILSYICVENKEKDQYLLERLSWEEKNFRYLQNRVRSLRSIIGDGVAKEMQKYGQGLVAMGKFNIIHLCEGEFLTLPNTHSIVLGSGIEMASILLDHNLSYDEIYSALRSSGVPTGATYDKYTVDNDLSDKFPPITDPGFFATIIRVVRKSIHREKMEKGLTEEIEKRSLYLLAETFALLLSMGNLRNKRWRFRKKPFIDFTKPETVKNEFYQHACLLLKIDPEERTIWLNEEE